MYDYAIVLELLRASAGELRRRALSNDQVRVARLTGERTLRNRALLIVKRLQGMPEAPRRAFVETAVRHL